MEMYRDVDPSFVDKFIPSNYVDDMSLGSSDVESTYELYLKSKSQLAEALRNLSLTHMSYVVKLKSMNNCWRTRA